MEKFRFKKRFLAIALFVPLITLLAADDILIPRNQGKAFLKDNDNRVWPAQVCYTTDGQNHIRTLANSEEDPTDDISVPKGQGRAYLTDSMGRLFPANVCYTTDGNGNVIPITGGGGGGSGSVTSVGLSLPNIFSVTGSPVTSTGTLTGSLANQNSNLVFAGPSSGSASSPSFRSLVEADIPSISASKISDFDTAVSSNSDVAANTSARHNAMSLGTSNGLSLSTQTLSLQSADSTHTGALTSTDWNTFNSKVSSVGLSLPNIFSVSGSPVTSSGTLSATLANQSANLFFAGPSSGSAAAPSFRAIAPADLPIVTSEVTISSGTLTLDLNNAYKGYFSDPDHISSDFTLALSNASNVKEFTLQLIIAGTVVITMPTEFAADANNSDWNSTLRKLTLTGTQGRFQIHFTKAVSSEQYYITSVQRFVPNPFVPSVPTELGELFLYNTFPTLADFTVNNSSGSITSVSNQLRFTGGAGVFNDRILFTKSDSKYRSQDLEKWRQRITFITPSSITSTTYGVGVGVRSSNSAYRLDGVVRLAMDTATGLGSMYFYSVINGTSNTLQNGGSYTLLANTTYQFEVELNQDVITARLYDSAGTTLLSSQTYTYGLTSVNANNRPPNTGSFALWNFGGTFNVTRWEAYSTQNKNIDILAVGDSNVHGLYATTVGDRYVSRDVGAYVQEVLAGIGDGIGELYANRDLYVEMNPKVIFFNAFSNDIANGVSSSTYQTNYTDLVNYIKAAIPTIKIVHAVPIARGYAFGSLLNSFFSTNFSGETVLDCYTLTKQAGNDSLQSIYNSGDNIHLNLQGHTDLGDDYATAVISNL